MDWSIADDDGGVVDSWGVDESTRDHQTALAAGKPLGKEDGGIGSYLASQKNRSRSRGDKPSQPTLPFSRPPPSLGYGYQGEPAKPSPRKPVKHDPLRERRVPPAPAGAWDDSVGTGNIPRYSWDKDPVRLRREAALQKQAEAAARLEEEGGVPAQGGGVAGQIRRGYGPAAARREAHLALSSAPARLGGSGRGQTLVVPGRASKRGAPPPPGGRLPPLSRLALLAQQQQQHRADHSIPRSHSEPPRSPAKQQQQHDDDLRTPPRRPPNASRDTAEEEPDEMMESTPVPPQHPYRGSIVLQQRPQLSKATVRAYASAPPVRAGRLPPLSVPKNGGTSSHGSAPRRSGRPAPPGAKSASNRSRTANPPVRPGAAPVRRGVSVPAPPKRTVAAPPKQGLPTRGSSSNTLLGTSSRDTLGNADGGERPTNSPPTTGRANGASDPEAEERVAAALQADIERLRLALGEEKAARREAQLMKEDHERALADGTRGLGSLKKEIAALQNEHKTVVKVEREAKATQTKAKAAEGQLRDLKRMLRVATEQRDERRKEEQHRVPQQEPASLVAPPAWTQEQHRASLRDLTTKKATLKKMVTDLAKEKAALTDQLTRMQLAAADRAQRHAVLEARVRQERVAAVEEARVKLAADLDRELSRLRETHEKAARHRQREAELKAEAQAKARAQHMQRIDESMASREAAGRNALQLKCDLSSATRAVDEAQKELLRRQEAHSEANRRQGQQQRIVDDARRTAAVAARDLEAARQEEARPSGGPVIRDAEQEVVRRKLEGEVADRKAEEASLLTRLKQVEGQIEAVKARACSQRNDVEHVNAQRRKAIQSKVDEAEAAEGRAKERLSKATKRASALEAKDAEIERLTRAVADLDAKFRAADTEQSRLLERLDNGERLLSVGGL